MNKTTTLDQCDIKTAGEYYIPVEIDDAKSITVSIRGRKVTIKYE